MKKIFTILLIVTAFFGPFYVAFHLIRMRYVAQLDAVKAELNAKTTALPWCADDQSLKFVDGMNVCVDEPKPIYLTVDMCPGDEADGFDSDDLIWIVEYVFHQKGELGLSSSTIRKYYDSMDEAMNAFQKELDLKEPRQWIGVGSYWSTDVRMLAAYEVKERR